MSLPWVDQTLKGTALNMLPCIVHNDAFAVPALQVLSCAYQPILIQLRHRVTVNPFMSQH